MRDTLHNSRFTRIRYDLRKNTYEIISVLCKTNPILSAVGGLQMNISNIITMNYKNFIPLAGYKNKPNSNPNKPNLQKAQMDVNLTLTKYYRKNDTFVVRINKPNFVKGPKLAQTHFSQRIMKMSHPQAPKKQTQNKANFFKGQNRLPKNLATPHDIQAKFTP